MRIKQIKKVSENLNKRGRIKGKNKKETKMLKDACMHHVYKRNGKLKPIVFRNEDYLICRGCAKRIIPKVFSMEDIKDRYHAWDEVVQNGKYVAAATNAGQEAANILCEAATVDRLTVKTMKKLNKVANKQNQIKRKKKQGSNSSKYYGSWRHKK